MASLDISIVNVALPAISQGLQVSQTGLQWVVDAYSLCLSALILLAGSLADRFGGKPVWLCGVLLFTLGSAVCAFAADITTLLGGRALQGTGAAAVIPAALSLLSQAILDPQRRARAIGIWSAVSGIALIAGPTTGGMLVHASGWQAIFWLNLPLGLVTLLLGYLSLPQSSRCQQTALHPLRQLVIISMLSLVTLGLIRAGTTGWHNTLTLLLLLMAALLLSGFITSERRSSQPLLPVCLSRNGDFILYNLASLMLGFSSYTSVFFISLLFQKIYGWSAIISGFAMAPQFIATMLASILFGRIASRISILLLQISGYGLIGLALLLLAFLPAQAGYPLVLALLILLGTGGGLSVPATSALIMGCATAPQAGLVSSLMNALRQSGMTFGIALGGSIMNQQAITRLSRMLQQQGITPAPVLARTLISDPLSLTDSRFHGLSQLLPQLTRLALHHGFSRAMLCSALSCGALTLLLVFRYRKHQR